MGANWGVGMLLCAYMPVTPEIYNRFKIYPQ